MYDVSQAGAKTEESGLRRRFTLRHQYLNLTKQRHNLLCTEPLFRHDQLLSKPFSHIADRTQRSTIGRRRRRHSRLWQAI